jgi:hypothetical protein
MGWHECIPSTLHSPSNSITSLSVFFAGASLTATTRFSSFPVGGSNDLVVADSSLLDYETATSHDVTVLVTDAHGATFSKTFTIALNDVNDKAPIFTSGNSASTLETVATGTVIYYANPTDADATPSYNTITWQ